MYLVNLIRSFVRKEEGQTLSEYALILVLIAVVCIAAVTLLGQAIVGVLGQITGALS